MIITLVNLAIKIFTCSLGTFLSGYGGETALRVGLGKSNVGEFYFVVAKIGQDFKATSSFLYPISIFVALVTTFFTPYLMKVAPLVTSGMSKFAPNGLKTLFSYYTLWMSRLKQEAVGRGPLSIATRNILRSIFVDISIIAFIAIVLQIAYSYTLEQFNFYELYLAASSIVATIALPFPFVMMLLRNLGCLTDLASELLLKTSPSNRS